jgi:trimeric autotransporter adhesin
MAGKIQKQDVKTEAELTLAGASASDLINDTQIYVSASGINKTLDDAIADGDISGLSTLNRQTFTSSGSWVVPTGVTEVMFRIASGGGGGGGGRAVNGGGGAGGAGCFPAVLNHTVVPGDTLTITIGAGGAAGTAGGGNGGTGGTTTITGTGVSLGLLGGPGGEGGVASPVSDGTYTADGGSRRIGGAFFQSGGSATVVRLTIFGTTYSFSATSGEGTIDTGGGGFGNGTNDSGGGGAGIGNGGAGGANAAGSAGGISAGGGGGGGNNPGGAGGAGRVFIYWVA